MKSHTQTQQRWLVIALCPAIAVSDLAASSLGIALAIVFACVLVTFAGRALHALDRDLRAVLITLILAAAISSLGLWLQAWVPGLRTALGIFLPLLIVNLAIIRQSEPAAGSPGRANFSLKIIAALTLLGFARELVGRGSLLHDAASLGNWAQGASLQLFPADMGFLLAMLPPGAFIAFGLLLAARNWISHRHHDESGGYEESHGR